MGSSTVENDAIGKSVERAEYYLPRQISESEYDECESDIERDKEKKNECMGKYQWKMSFIIIQGQYYFC